MSRLLSSLSRFSRSSVSPLRNGTQWLSSPLSSSASLTTYPAVRSLHLLTQKPSFRSHFQPSSLTAHHNISSPVTSFLSSSSSVSSLTSQVPTRIIHIPLSSFSSATSLTSRAKRLHSWIAEHRLRILGVYVVGMVLAVVVGLYINQNVNLPQHHEALTQALIYLENSAITSDIFQAAPGTFKIKKGQVFNGNYDEENGRLDLHFEIYTPSGVEPVHVLARRTPWEERTSPNAPVWELTHLTFTLQDSKESFVFDFSKKEFVPSPVYIPRPASIFSLEYFGLATQEVVQKAREDDRLTFGAVFVILGLAASGFFLYKSLSAKSTFLNHLKQELRVNPALINAMGLKGLSEKETTKALLILNPKKTNQEKHVMRLEYSIKTDTRSGSIVVDTVRMDKKVGHIPKKEPNFAVTKPTWQVVAASARVYGRASSVSLNLSENAFRK